MFKKVTRGNMETIQPVVIGVKDGIKILKVSDKKIHTMYGVETDIAIASLSLDGEAEDVIIVGEKFWKKKDKSYQQDMITLMAKRIILSATNNYAYDDEVEARYDAMKERDKTGFFGRRSFTRSVNKHEKAVNASISRASKYAIKNGLNNTPAIDITLKQDVYAAEEEVLPDPS